MWKEKLMVLGDWCHNSGLFKGEKPGSDCRHQRRLPWEAKRAPSGSAAGCGCSFLP